MEAEISQGRPKALPAMQNVSQTSSVGDKNKEVAGGEAKLKFGQLIHGKIIKIVATIYHILRLKIKNATNSISLGSSQRSPSLLAGFKGSYI